MDILARVVSGQLSIGKPICSRNPLVSFLSKPSRVHFFYRSIKITTGHVCKIDPLNQNFLKFWRRKKWNGSFLKIGIENFGQPLEVVLFPKNLEIPGIFCSLTWSYHFIIRFSTSVSSAVMKTVGLIAQ